MVLDLGLCKRERKKMDTKVSFNRSNLRGQSRELAMDTRTRKGGVDRKRKKEKEQ